LVQVNSPGIQPQADHSSDDIDLFELLKSLLATWKIWLLSLVIVSGFYGAAVVSKFLLVSSEVTYSKPIRLTFPDAHKLKFPNGAIFSFGDIVAPAVVQAAYQRNRLDEYGLTVTDLQGSLSAEPYAPTYPLIIQRYQRIMGDKRLSIEQLEDVQKRMQAELDQATRGSVLISMRLEKHRLPVSVASKVLSDIPAIWAERTIKDKGVLNLNIELASSRSLNSHLIQSVEYMIIGDLLDEKLKLLRGNIEKLSEFEGVLTIADPETGMRLPDLENAIDDLSRYVIDELMSPVRYLGLSRDAQLSIYYYEDRLKKLKMDLGLLNNQASLAKDAYDNYRRGEQSVARGEVAPLSAGPQLSGDALDKLLQMSGEVERETYKQGLNEQWLTFNLKAAEVKNLISDVELILASLYEAGKDRDGASTIKNQLYLDRVVDSLPGILERLDGYFTVTERIYDQLNIESVGVRDRLYSPITNSVIVDSVFIDIKKTAITWLALLFLVSAIVVPTVMVRNAIKNRC